MALIPLATMLLSAFTTTIPADSVPLYTDLGSHHHEISTPTPRTQEYFDQGLRLVFAFNHGEAIRAFTEAARLDSTCAMCYWGMALAYGPHVNAPMDSAGSVAAYAALSRAVALAGHASLMEKAYIQALSRRYAASPPANRAGLDSAYALAMKELVGAHPSDLDAATLYAESLMDLRPWNYWKKDGTAYPGTDIIMAQLERVISQDPNHPGACHYYIHAVEAVTPAKAIPCAERLASLMPGAGHMVHMPGHIYIRVGRYNDAIQANVHAVHTDESYIAAEHPAGVYPLGYYPHNYHFLSFAATMAGRSQEAIDAGRKLSAAVPVEAARQVPAFEMLIPYDRLVLVTFGRWDDILALPLPPSDLRMSNGLSQYARGIAFAAKGQWQEAGAALDTVIMIARGTTPADQAAMTAGEGENKKVIDIAMHALMGEIASRHGQLDQAEQHFRQAVTIEDSFNYIEPPQWYYPLRWSLGAILLKAGKPGEAESVYREDLTRFPENGWALFGLAASLRAQGKSVEAASIEQRRSAAWRDADITLTASHF
jgi:tetratricopeptide (TPR) repeat protein